MRRSHRAAINGRYADERLAVRRARVAPLVSDLEPWMQAQCAKLSRHNDLAKSMNDMLHRCDTFMRFLDDGCICLTNNAPSGRRAASRLGASCGCSPAPIAVASLPP